MVFEQTIILNKESFKALSSESRINILSSLKERRRTLSELSTKLNLGNSTVKEHCQILMDAGLIRLVDEGRKWKYYELTPKGKQIISPDLIQEAKVFVMLCISVLAFIGLIYFVINKINQTPTIHNIQQNNSTLDYAIMKINNVENNANQLNTFQQSNNISFETLIQTIAISLIIGIGIGWIARKKVPIA